MPLITEKVPEVRVVTVGFVCDKCGEKHLDNDLESQEALIWRNTGGYGSIWGDGNTWELVLCQRCAFALLGPFAREVSVRHENESETSEEPEVREISRTAAGIATHQGAKEPGPMVQFETLVSHDELIDSWLPEAEAAIEGFGSESFGISRLQRALRFGYNRTAMIIERLIVLGRLKQNGYQYKRIKPDSTSTVTPKVDP